VKNLDWMDSAACKDHPDPDSFFPSLTGVAGQRQAAAAARICNECPVQVQCQQHKKATGAASGVWGGRRSVVKNAAPSSGGPHNLQPCGTAAGYRRHHRHGEKPCRACLAAHSRSTRKTS
jgi:hypothetical protein